jgi:hypothetical protein
MGASLAPAGGEDALRVPEWQGWHVETNGIFALEDAPDFEPNKWFE